MSFRMASLRGKFRGRAPESAPKVHGMQNSICTPQTPIETSNANSPHRQVQVMSTLPLKAISRLWGRFNELTIPYYLRVPGFKLYSMVFGVK